MADYVKVAKSGDIAPGHGKAVEVNGQKIAVLNCDNSFHAIEDTCPHKGGPLSEGTISDGSVRCPWHGAIFVIETGEPVSGPAPCAVKVYPCRVSGDDIEIQA